MISKGHDIKAYGWSKPTDSHNTSKGYDIFGNAILKILDKYPKWKSLVIGDEPREKIFFSNKNLKVMGFQNHKIVLDTFKKSSIAVACSRWEEPFGRTSLEASANGCAVIITDKGCLLYTSDAADE